MSFAVKNAIPFVDDLIKEYLVFRGFTRALLAFETEKKNDKMKGFEVLPCLASSPFWARCASASCAKLFCSSGYQVGRTCPLVCALPCLGTSGRFVAVFGHLFLLPIGHKSRSHCKKTSSLAETLLPRVCYLCPTTRQSRCMFSFQNVLSCKLTLCYIVNRSSLRFMGKNSPMILIGRTGLVREIYVCAFCLVLALLCSLAIMYIKNPDQHETFAPFFKRQWATTFSQSLHNFLNTVFSRMRT
jgi:hypothetical protein